MTTSDARETDRVTELREAFDRSFAQAPITEAAAVESLLAIRVGADPYVLRMTEVVGLFADKKVTRLPSPVSELSGIAGFRGAVLPVYDLAMLLGYPRAMSPRWLVVIAVTPVALAFDSFDGYLNVRDAAIVLEARPEERERHVREVVQAVDLVRPLISVASVLEWIRSRASGNGLAKEQ
jgi:purine-binding chemotaxis protein CheW